jgi:hypothetical protein
MVVLNKKAFKLPRVEKEKFMLLINAGLCYNREQCLYSIKSYNDIENLMDIINDILNSDFSSKLHSMRQRFCLRRLQI